jgi:hypothetical protein
MVKNLKGGNKAKGMARKKIHEAMAKPTSLRLKNDILEYYAVAVKMYGNNYFSALCHDGIERKCLIPGKFRTKNKFNNFVGINTWVLIGLECYADTTNLNEAYLKTLTKGFLLEVYTNEEVQQLKNNDLSIQWKILIEQELKLGKLNTKMKDEDLDIEFTNEEEYAKPLNNITISANNLPESHKYEKYLAEEIDEIIDIDDI